MDEGRGRRGGLARAGAVEQDPAAVYICRDTPTDSGKTPYREKREPAASGAHFLLVLCRLGSSGKSSLPATPRGNVVKDQWGISRLPGGAALWSRRFHRGMKKRCGTPAYRPMPHGGCPCQRPGGEALWTRCFAPAGTLSQGYFRRVSARFRSGALLRERDLGTGGAGRSAGLEDAGFPGIRNTPGRGRCGKPQWMSGSGCSGLTGSNSQSAATNAVTPPPDTSPDTRSPGRAGVVMNPLAV